jgi:hypothetical protein
VGIREDRFVDCFYEKYRGRVAIGVGYGQDLMEIFPFVMEDDDGKALGIIAMATLSNEHMNSVHIFHFSVFHSRCGNGSKMLKILCLKADQLNIRLSLSPIPSPNGEPSQMNSEELSTWYRSFGFSGDSLLCRLPQITKAPHPPVK